MRGKILVAHPVSRSTMKKLQEAGNFVMRYVWAALATGDRCLLCLAAVDAPSRAPGHYAGGRDAFRPGTPGLLRRFRPWGWGCFRRRLTLFPESGSSPSR